MRQVRNHSCVCVLVIRFRRRLKGIIYKTQITGFLDVLSFGGGTSDEVVVDALPWGPAMSAWPERGREDRVEADESCLCCLSVICSMY